MTNTWTTTFTLACTLLLLDACQLGSAPKVQESDAVSSGAAGVPSTKSNAARPMRPNADGGVTGMTSNTSVSTAKGASSGSKPSESDAGMKQIDKKDAPASSKPSSSTMDAGATQTGSAPMADKGKAKSPEGMSDAGQMDAASSATEKMQPSAAGSPASAGSGAGPAPTIPTVPTTPPTVPSASGAMAPEPPDAGNESTMPEEPACTPAFPGATCDTAPQCGCAQGENCAYLSLDFPACVRAGAAGLNQRCVLSTDCKVGLQCSAGACLQLCDPDQQGCDDDFACNQNFSYGRPIPGHLTCSSNCNLVDPQRATQSLVACGSGLTCILYGKGSDCARGSGEGRHGELCESSLDCAPGYNCTENGMCARWCETQRDCPDGYACEEENVTVRDTRFGLCRPTCGNSRDLNCEVDPQCGCEGNMACDFLHQNDRYVHACRQTGRGALYTRCEVDQDCIGGASCIGSACAPFCQRDSDCDGTYSRCIQVNDGSISSNPPIPGYRVCKRPCDPRDLARPHGPYQSCPDGQGCQATTDGFSFCRYANADAQWGDACSSSSECAIGYECSGNFGCSPQCQTNSDCATGYSCVAFSPSLWADTQAWGVCTPNQ